jgi:adenylate cyclase
LPQNIEIERRLAAVLAADVAGFTRLTEVDEVGTMRLLAAQRAILDAAIARHRGRIANTAGDSVLAEFPSAVNAVKCAVEAQQALRDASEGASEDRRVLFRIGIHVGDVMVRGGDLLGSGVNVAARLEALADAGGIVVSAAAHEQVKKILPLAYTDLGPQQVKNIEEPVRAFAIGSVPVSLPGEGKPLPLPDKPSIAVLPFQNMSGDPEQEYFADGMAEDIITALSRFKSLFVIARNSSFTYKGRAVDIKRVGNELGVRYILEGSVRKAAGQVRITGQLIETVSGMHIWAEKFDGALENVFDLQDRVTAQVVGAIVPRIDEASIDIVKRKRPDDLNSYDHYLRGRMLLQQASAEAIDGAEAEFQKAIAIDPDSALAYAFASACLHRRRRLTSVPATDAERIAAVALADRAISLGGDDDLVLATAWRVIANVDNQIERGMSIADRAVALNPNSAAAWIARGWSSVYMARLDQASEAFDRTIRLNPLDRENVRYARFGKAWVCELCGKHDEGSEWARQMLAQDANDLAGLMMLESNLFRAGRREDARKVVDRIHRTFPRLTLSHLRRLFANPGPSDQSAQWAQNEDRLGLPE